jgi:DNA-binding NarL/FixJ family response regulator
MAAAEPRIAILGGRGAFATDALSWMLTKSGSRVVGAFPSFAELEPALSEGGPDLQAVIVDGDDPAAGTAAVTEIRRAHPKLKILLLCEKVSPSLVSCAINQQVEGLVLQSDAAEHVVLALHHVLDGRAVMPAGWQQAVREQNQGLARLSTREREVLELAALGMSNKEIAERLVISLNTVKFHLRAIYSRLGVHNRVQAAQVVCR